MWKLWIRHCTVDGKIVDKGDAVCCLLKTDKSEVTCYGSLSVSEAVEAPLMNEKNIKFTMQICLSEQITC